MNLSVDNEVKLYRLLGRLEYLAKYRNDDIIKIAYEELCDVLGFKSIFEQEEEEQQEEQLF